MKSYIAISMMVAVALSTNGVRREYTKVPPKAISEVFAEFPCHNELEIFNLIELKDFEAQVVQGKVLAGIPQENKSYEFVYPFKAGPRRLKFEVWRVGDNIYGEASVSLNGNAAYKHQYQLVWYAVDSEDCFRAIPTGCVHEENSNDTFIDICEGYDAVSTGI